MDLDYDPLDETLTISSAEMNLRLDLTPEELRSLAHLESADWGGHRSLSAGAAPDQPAHWCVGNDRGTALVLVGPDDETWFLGVTVPLAERHVLAVGCTDVEAAPGPLPAAPRVSSLVRGGTYRSS